MRLVDPEGRQPTRLSYARDGALPGSGRISRVNQRFRTPVNALPMGAVITVLFCLLVYVSPGPDRNVEQHLHDTLEPTGAELPGAAQTT